MEQDGSPDGAGGRLGIYYTPFRASSLLLFLLEGTVTDVPHFGLAIEVPEFFRHVWKHNSEPLMNNTSPANEPDSGLGRPT